MAGEHGHELSLPMQGISSNGRVGAGASRCVARGERVRLRLVNATLPRHCGSASPATDDG